VEIPTVRSVIWSLAGVVVLAVLTPARVPCSDRSFSPPPGQYTKPVTITSTAPANTRIYYTLDGTEPSAASPVFTRPVTLVKDTVIRYFTVGPGGSRSSVQEVFYRIRPRGAVEGELRTVADPPAGLYSGRVRITLTAPEGATVYYTVDGTDPSTDSSVYQTPILLTVDTLLKFFAVKADGTREPVREEMYRFKLASQMLDTTPPEVSVIPQPDDYRAGDFIRLTASEEADIYYTLDGSDPTEKSIRYDGPFWLDRSSEVRFFAIDPSGNRSRIYRETYQLDQEAPFSEAYPGTGLYNSPITVRITVSDADARVYYSINGIPPTTDSPQYREPLVLKKDTFLQFFSVDPFGNREETKAETYLFDDEAPVTVADPPGGSYVPPIHVTLSTETGARTHYTLDGSDPDTQSPIYFTGFTFKKTTVLKYFSMDGAGNRENIQTQQYKLVNGVWRKYTRGIYLIPSITDGRTFWMGSESGLAVYNVGSGDRSFIGENQGLLGNIINDLVLDEQGQLWAATDRGLNHFLSGGGVRHYTRDEGLPDSEVLSLGVDRDGSVWAGTRKGVCRIQGGAVRETLNVESGLPNDTVLSIAVDYSGNKWFGTLKGLARFTGTGWRVFTRQDGMIDNEVRTVALDSRWNVWVGTPRGVSVFDGDKWTDYTKNDGLPGDGVVLIVPEPGGGVWVATRTGVARYSDGQWIKENAP